MKKLCIFLLLSLPLFVFSQEIHINNNDSHHNDFKRFKISLAFAQSYIPSYHFHSESETAQFIPTDGIEIQYFFNHKFFAKWTNEVEFLTYTIVEPAGEHRVRDNAFLSILTFGYEFYDKLAIVAGAGYEFEKNLNLWVCRIGLEYSIPMYNNWELSPELLYDIKKESHTAYTIGFSLGYKF